jgi:transposase
MIRTTGVRIWLATSPVDMRRSFDALAEHVRTILTGDTHRRDPRARAGRGAM